MPKILEALSTIRRPAVAGGLALALAIGAGGLYGTALRIGKNGDPDCAASAPTLARLRPLAHGEVAGFEVAREPAKAVPVSFETPEGGRRTLSDFRGRTVLLNLWATWCEPCKREMPALDRLEAELGGPRFEVAAVNIDTRNLDRPNAWLDAAGIGRLVRYSDREANIFRDLRNAGEAEGMPTTILIDAQGCRLGRLSGPAEWASADGLALIRAALGP